MEEVCCGPVVGLFHDPAVVERSIVPHLLSAMHLDRARFASLMPPAAPPAGDAAASGAAAPLHWWQGVVQAVVDQQRPQPAAEPAAVQNLLSSIRSHLDRGHVADLSYSAQMYWAVGKKGQRYPAQFCMRLVAGGSVKCQKLARQLAAVTDCLRELGSEMAAGLREDLIPPDCGAERRLAQDRPWTSTTKPVGCSLVNEKRAHKAGSKPTWKVQTQCVRSEDALGRTKVDSGRVYDLSIGAVCSDLQRITTLWPEKESKTCRRKARTVDSNGRASTAMVPRWNHPTHIYFRDAAGHARWRARHERFRQLIKAADGLRKRLSKAFGEAFRLENRALLSSRVFLLHVLLHVRVLDLMQ